MHDKQTEALIAQIAEVLKDAKPVKLSPATMRQVKAIGRLVATQRDQHCQDREFFLVHGYRMCDVMRVGRNTVTLV
jgi:hypothetical protein